MPTEQCCVVDDGVSCFLVWYDFSPRLVSQLLTAPDRCDRENLIASVLSKHKRVQRHYARHMNADSRIDSLVELLYDAHTFAVELSLTASQVSALLSIALNVALFAIAADTDVADVRHSHPTVRESHRLLERYLIAHSIHRPPKQIALFRQRETAEIVRFFSRSLFRHYGAFVLLNSAQTNECKRLNVSVTHSVANAVAVRNNAFIDPMIQVCDASAAVTNASLHDDVNGVLIRLSASVDSNAALTGAQRAEANARIDRLRSDYART